MSKNWVLLTVILLASFHHEYAGEILEYDQDILPVYNQEIEVSTKTATIMALAPSSVTVFDKEDLVRTGAKYLSDLLQLVPGFIPQPYFLLENDRSNGGESVNTRGFNDNNGALVLLLKDGVRLNESYSGSIQLMLRSVSLRGIRRIEIIRGPGYTIYGSNTLLGVIQLYSETIHNQVSVDKGSFGEENLYFSMGSDKGAIKFNTTFELGNREHYKRYPSPVLFPEAFLETTREDFNSSFKAQYKDFKISYQNDVYEHNTTSQATPLTKSINRIEIMFDVLNVNYKKKFAHDDQINLSFSTGSDKYIDRNLNYGISKPISSEGPRNEGFEIRSRLIDGIFEYQKFSERWGMSQLGFEFLQQSVGKANSFSNVMVLPPKDIAEIVFVDQYESPIFKAQNLNTQIVSFYVQNQKNLSPLWTLTSGVRIEKSNRYGWDSLLRLGLVFEQGAHVLKALYGEGLVQPLFDIQHPDAPLYPSNYFKPTKAKSFELIYWWRKGPIWQVLTLYDIHEKGSYLSNYTDDRDPNAYTNDDIAFYNNTKSGIEWEFHWNLKHGGHISTDYSYFRPSDIIENATTEEGTVSFRPIKRKASLLATSPGRTIWANAELLYYDPLVTGYRIDPVNFLNIGIHYRPYPFIEIRAKIKNLAENDYWTQNSIPTAPFSGRSFEFSASYKK